MVFGDIRLVRDSIPIATPTPTPIQHSADLTGLGEKPRYQFIKC